MHRIENVFFNNLIMKINITYIISNINKSLAFEWISDYLDKGKFNLNFILLNPGESELENYLIQKGVSVYRINYTSKRDIPKAIFKTYKILKKNGISIVHTHLFDANIIGLFAAWLARIPKRIHTRHHSDYHHIYFPKAVIYDKFINSLSTTIIAISSVVKDILIIKEKVSEKNIRIIHHGFKLDEFLNVPESLVGNLKVKYIKNNFTPVIGVISRYTEWKGIQYIIPAFQRILHKYPNALLVLANASGDYKIEIQNLLQKIPKENYIEISFESNIYALYKLFDIFIHVPISSDAEAFGQTYVESLASGIPSIFTLSGIANEFIKDKQNALVIPFKNSDAIYNAVTQLLTDRDLSNRLKINGINDVQTNFKLKKMITSLEQLYEE